MLSEMKSITDIDIDCCNCIQFDRLRQLPPNLQKLYDYNTKITTKEIKILRNKEINVNIN